MSAATISVDEFMALEQKVLQTVELIKTEREARTQAESARSQAEYARAEAESARADAERARAHAAAEARRLAEERLRQS